MSNRPRSVIYFNTGARGGGAARRLRAALAGARQAAIASDVIAFASPRELRAAVRRLPVDAVPVAAGGDGTVNLLVTVLREAGWDERAIAVLPLGTGNAFAHALGVASVPRALAALASGCVRRIDLMRTTHPQAPAATTSISTGFEAAMLAHVGRRRGWHRWVGGLAHLAHRRWTGAVLAVHDAPLLSVSDWYYNAGVYNLPCYGFGKVVLPEAVPEDGAAEAVACRTRAAYWRSLLGGARTAAPGAGDPRTRRWSHARFEAPDVVQIDGEVVSGSCFDVWVERQALRVLVPPPGQASLS
jgi:diacylglycerol kinase family enzyme